MPHLIIEYSRNTPEFDAHALLLECNQALFASGQFTEIDIKSRAVRHDVFVIGTDPAHRAFVYARLALLSGRPPEIKRDLAQRLQAVLEKFFPHSGGLNLQLSVELQDMDRDSFLKTFIKN